jgi:hypothetical protein
MSTPIIVNPPQRSVAATVLLANPHVDNNARAALTPLVTLLDTVSVPGTPVRSVNATGTITLTSTGALDGDTLVVSGTTYEYRTNGTLTPGRTKIDINAGSVAAAGTLTVAVQPTAGDTITIGGVGYLFISNGATPVAGQIRVGTNLSTAQANIVAAINGSDGVNAAHQTVVSEAAFSANASVITALIKGTGGNSIGSTSSFTSGSNHFDAVTLGTTTAGANMSAANQCTAIINAMAADVNVVATQGGGTTVTLTAVTGGIYYNSIVTTTSAHNTSFGSGTLTGGINGTSANAGEFYFDSSFLYIAKQNNTIQNSIWWKISITGSL